MLDDLAGDDGVERAARKRQLGHIGLHHLTANLVSQNVDSPRRDVGADDVVSPRLEQARERSLTCTDVQDAPARDSREKQVEEKLFSQLMTLSDEIGRRHPPVLDVRAPVQIGRRPWVIAGARSEDWGFSPHTPDLTQRVAHLAERHVVPGRIDNRQHEVHAVLRRGVLDRG